MHRRFLAAGLVAFAFTPSVLFAQASPTPGPTAAASPAAVASPVVGAASSPAPAAPAPGASAGVATVDPAIFARAKDWMHRAQTGNIDRSQLDDQMNALLTDSLATQVAAQVGPLGDPTAFTFVDKHRIGTDTGYRFLATFKAAKLYWLFAVNDSGKISGLRFLPVQ